MKLKTPKTKKVESDYSVPNNDLLVKNAVMFYGASVLPQLRRMTFEERKAVLDEAGELALREPLHMHPKQDLEVKSWEPDKKVGGCYVIALMVFGLFVQIGEREEMCSGLMETWPIREAVLLAS